tara:strand:- start:2 stop:505 length:504 start_codon:yes stop_codon:yes gene_type:complete
MKILGLENYMVSEHGQIKRLECVVNNKRYGKQKLKERLLNPAKNHDGYMRVRLPIGFKFVHVLILESFICPRYGNMQACHNNGIPDDNRLENLRWDTPKNNVNDRRFHGTYQFGSKNPNSKYSEEQKKAVFLSKKSIKELAEELNLSINSVYYLRFKTKKHMSILTR